MRPCRFLRVEGVCQPVEESKVELSVNRSRPVLASRTVIVTSLTARLATGRLGGGAPEQIGGGPATNVPIGQNPEHVGGDPGVRVVVGIAQDQEPSICIPYPLGGGVDGGAPGVVGTKVNGPWR